MKDEAKAYQESLKKKVQFLNATKDKAKLYIFEALKAIASYTERIALKILNILKELVKHSAQQVAAGCQAHISQTYFYCFLLGVMAIAASFSKALNLLWPSRVEGIDRWEAHFKDLVKEFSETLPGACLEFAMIILKEIIILSKRLQVELLKRIEAQNAMIQELQAEICVLKADRFKTEKILDEMNSEIKELRKAISKTEDLSEPNSSK